MEAYALCSSGRMCGDALTRHDIRNSGITFHEYIICFEVSPEATNTTIAVLLKDEVNFKIGNCWFKSFVYLCRYDMPLLTHSEYHGTSDNNVLCRISRHTKCESTMTSLSFPPASTKPMLIISTADDANRTCTMSFDSWANLEAWRRTIATIAEYLTLQHTTQLCSRMIPSLRKVNDAVMGIYDCSHKIRATGDLRSIVAELAGLMVDADELENSLSLSCEQRAMNLAEVSSLDVGSSPHGRLTVPRFLGSCLGNIKAVGDVDDQSPLLCFFADDDCSDDLDCLSSVLSNDYDCASEASSLVTDVGSFWHVVDTVSVDVDRMYPYEALKSSSPELRGDISVLNTRFTIDKADNATCSDQNKTLSIVLNQLPGEEEEVTMVLSILLEARQLINLFWIFLILVLTVIFYLCDCDGIQPRHYLRHHFDATVGEIKYAKGSTYLVLVPEPVIDFDAVVEMSVVQYGCYISPVCRSLNEIVVIPVVYFCKTCYQNHYAQDALLFLEKIFSFVAMHKI
jgi:hypothetical protein